MFRCKECGSEYEEKPDYCDCGNDTFEEITVQQPVPTATPAEQIKQEVKKSSTQPSPQPKQHYDEPKKTFSEQYPELERLKSTFDPIATVIFMTCVILACIVIFFVGNPKEETETEKAEAPKAEQKLNLPSIDSFWNNSTAGIINNEKSKPQKTVQTQPVQQQAKNPILALAQQKQEQSQPVTTIPVQNIPQQKTTVQQPIKTTPQVQPKPQNTVNTKQTTTKPATTQTQKPVTTQTQKPATTQTPSTPKIPKTTRSIATQPKSTTSTNTNKQQSQTTKPATTQTQKPATTQTTKPATTQTQKPTTASTTTKPSNTTVANIPTASTMRPKATIDTQALKKELDNYKIGLRNTIGRKVDFTRVVGDGECVVAFKIASNGKLTNRSFAKQSSNITLNDAVYSAIMATPSYNPPPSGYNNETMNLKIRFYNGNYDVSLY